MEYILLAAIALNTAVTVWYGRLLLSREEYRIEFVSIPGEAYSIAEETQASSEQKEIPQPEAVPVPAQNKSYSAWENRKNIPLNEAYKPAEPPAPKPDGYGWVK